MAATVRSSSTYASAATEASFSVPLPAGFAAGDVCYIFAEGRAASGVFGTAPAGWTAVAASFASGASTSSFMACYRKVMAGGEGNPTVTGTSGRYSAVAVAVQGADNTTPEDVAVVTDNGGASALTTITSPGITPSSSSALLLIGFGCGTPATGQVITYSTPSGMTLAASTSTTVAAVTESGMMAASLALSSNTATGTEQTTITPSAIDGQTVTIAVRPAAAGAGAFPAQPGQTWLRRFHHRQVQYPTVIVPPVMAAVPAPLARPSFPSRLAQRARLGPMGACAAGIAIAAGLAAPAPAVAHRPPVAVATKIGSRARVGPGATGVGDGNPAPVTPVTVVMTAAGANSFFVPPGVTFLDKVECWGGGGGGGSGNGTINASNGGGGGEYAAETHVTVTGGTTYFPVVGAPGQGGATNNIAGTAGGNSVFAGDAVTVTGHGGSGGPGGSVATGGAAGTGSANTAHRDGGAGGPRTGTQAGGGGGGSSAGPAAAGNTGGSGGGVGGTGGTAVAGGGPGGAGGNNNLAGNPPASGPGGGGGGAGLGTSAFRQGGDGFTGQIVITYTPWPAPFVPAPQAYQHPQPQPRRPGPARARVGMAGAVGDGIASGVVTPLGTPSRQPPFVFRSPARARARVGSAGLPAGGIASQIITPLGSGSQPAPRPVLTHPAPRRGLAGPRSRNAGGIASPVITPLGTPGPSWRPQPRRPAPGRALWRGGAGPQPAVAATAYQRAPVLPRSPAPRRAVWRGLAVTVPRGTPGPSWRAQPRRPGPQRATWHTVAGPQPAVVTAVTAYQHAPPLPRSPAPRRGLWRGFTSQVVTPLGSLQARRPVVIAPPRHTRATTGHGQTGGGNAGPPAVAPPAPQAYQRPAPQIRRPGPSRAIWRGNAGPQPAPVAPVQRLPQPRSRPGRRAVWHGNASPVVTPLGTPARRPGPVITSRPRTRAVWHGGGGTAAPGIALPPRWRRLPDRKPPQRAVVRRGIGLANILPPAFTIGALTATGAPASTLTTATAASTLTAATAASSTLTAGTQRTGGPDG